MYENCTKTVRIYVVTAEITAKNAAAEHFGHFSVKNYQKSLKIWPGRHVQNLGVAFFLEKNRRRQPTPEHMGFLSGKIQDGLHGMASWQGPILAKHGFGTDWAPYGSKWSFDRLPEQEISRQIS